ncbi:MAG: bifunctional oligoribonuclease/PAP phosphatase NrnA [Candidatus Omnitrophica bacterium]|nr:bifunctional oligoribonuclease/PAP phosphatase NrnA [Candidatus Omnitrophota bacterium]
MKNATLIREIKQSRRFLIASHVNPDADGICGQLALARILRALGKTATVMTSELLPGRLSFVPDARRIKVWKPGTALSFDAAVILDCGDLERIGRVKSLINNHRVLNIDHHVTNRQFGRVNCVDPQASSTCEMLFDLAAALGVKMDRTTAWLLYAGMMTDTGSFRYENTASRTHRVAAELIAAGLKPAEIYHQFYERTTTRDLCLFLKIANTSERTNEGKIIWLHLTAKQVKAFSDEFDLRDALFHLWRTVVGVELIVIFTEMRQDSTRVNFRSLAIWDVAQLASRFGGGGHPRASGCTLPCGLREARNQVEQEIQKRINKKLE